MTDASTERGPTDTTRGVLGHWPGGLSPGADIRLFDRALSTSEMERLTAGKR